MRSTPARSISDEGVAFIKRWEGLVTTAYRDVAGVLTIGYGHTEGFINSHFTTTSEIDEEEAETLLRKDIASREARVRELVRIKMSQNEFDALVSFEFNTGALHRATALKLFNAGDRLAAAEALTWWNKARIGGRIIAVPGLTRRRAAEAALFIEPDRPSRRKPDDRTNGHCPPPIGDGS